MAPFPPKSAHPDQVALAIQTLATATGGRTALYVSTPITTGNRYVTWLRDGGNRLATGSSAYREQHIARVVEPNLRSVRPVIDALRASARQIVIDPTALPDVHGWQQDDYRTLWATVIERLADTIIFLDGWAFSEGCCYEWYTGYRTGARLLDAGRQPLGRDVALEQMAKAVRELKAVQAPTGFIEAVVDAVARS